MASLWLSGRLAVFLDPLAGGAVAEAEGVKTEARRVTVRALSRDGIVQRVVFLHCVQ